MSEKFFFDLALDQFKFIHEIYRNLDDKINKMLSTILTIEPILIALAYYLLKDNPSIIISFSFFLSFGSFTFAAIVGIYNNMPKKIPFTDTLKLYNKYLNEPLNEITELTAVIIADNAQKLQLQCNNKASLLRSMQLSIVSGISFLFIAFVFLVMGKYLIALNCWS